MLDQLYGKPSGAWKRTQVILVLLFWISRISRGNRNGPRLPFLRRLNRLLSRFTPWQIVVSTLTLVYAVKNGDAIFGLSAPEPLARLYSRNYYRATWIVTALDAGFATAMSIRWKWLRDIASLLFSAYYLIFANEADEKLRKYRAMCTVEMLRATWEKTSNPYIRLATSKDRPKVGIRRRIFLPRPEDSTYTKPIVAWIYYDGTELELSQQTNLIFDVPGGGFICMSPEHHEERILRWTIRTGLPIISLDYGKAPEYPWPWAIDEAYDTYKLLHAAKGKNIGMSGERLNIVLTGDSAGANIASAMTIKILETRPRLPMPVSLVFAYAALSLHFTSWMPSSDLRVLRQESSSNIAGLLRGKEHLEHRSPLSVVEDISKPKIRRRRTTSWGRSIGRSLSTSPARLFKSFAHVNGETAEDGDDEEDADDQQQELKREEDKSVSERVIFWDEQHLQNQAELEAKADLAGQAVLAQVQRGPLKTRLAMTSRTAFFNDRIISPSMCRAMALLYIGPNNAPDMHSDYHISPIFTPANLLAQFPPVYLSCGERDPFVDDTVIFAGKLREAKEARKLELLARETKHGESLRMSGPAAGRDPLLSESEEDWVQMNILGGWSHGYLQMTSLLPEAKHAIDMMADWITESFEKHAERTEAALATSLASKVLAHPPRIGAPAPPSRTSSKTVAMSETAVLASPPGFTSESDRDDDSTMLSFTPRRRRGSSRAESPSPNLRQAAAAATSPQGPSSPDEAGSSIFSGSTAASGSLPRTPEHQLSAMDLVSGKISSSTPVPTLAISSPAQSPRPPSQLVMPHERALRDELPRPSSTPAVSLSPPRARRKVSQEDQSTSPGKHDTAFATSSDDEKSLVPTRSLSPPSAEAHQSKPKTSRSGSSGALPLPMPMPAKLIDAKDLLRRRREEAVYGISTASSSAVPSDEDELEGEGVDAVKLKKSAGKKDALAGAASPSSPPRIRRN